MCFIKGYMNTDRMDIKEEKLRAIKSNIKEEH